MSSDQGNSCALFWQPKLLKAPEFPDTQAAELCLTAPEGCWQDWKCNQNLMMRARVHDLGRFFCLFGQPRSGGCGCFTYLASTLSDSCFGSPQPAVPISALRDCILLIMYTANPLQSKSKQLYFYVSSLTSKKARINLWEIQLWRDLFWGKK